jgi:hypothetical protein
MFEDIRNIRLGRFQRRDVQALEMAQVFGQARLVRLDRVNVAQKVQGEDPADHAGHFQEQLLLGGQRVNAADDHAVDGVWEVHLAQVAGIGRKSALAVRDGDQAGVAQGVSQFLAEEWVPFRPFADEAGYFRWQGGHVQTVADQGIDFRRGE